MNSLYFCFSQKVIISPSLLKDNFTGHRILGWCLFSSNILNILSSWGTWVAQSVKYLTLDLSSGLDLTVVSLSPTLGSMLGVEPADE